MGFALFGLPLNAEPSIPSHSLEKCPGDVRMMMRCMGEGSAAKALAKRFPDHMQQECRRREKSDYEMVRVCLRLWGENDERRIRDKRAHPFANAIPPSRGKAAFNFCLLGGFWRSLFTGLLNFNYEMSELKKCFWV